jgi:hypothetical protein
MATAEYEPKELAIKTEPMTQALATVDVRDASSEGLALMRKRVENQKEMIKIAISLTSPSQWTIFAGNGKETVYPTGGAADTILRRAFGLTWGEKTVTIEDTPQGPCAVCRAWLMQNGNPVEHFEGRRSFGGFALTESNMKKDAIENMKSVAVRDILGLRFRTPDELREMGLDIGKVKARAEFSDHKSGEELTMSFGKDKGKPISQISDEGLDWYIKVVGEGILDPAKQKYRASGEKKLEALKAEKAKRGGKQPASTDSTTTDDTQGREPGDD